MSEEIKNRDTMKIYQHSAEKYKGLNELDQTPAKFVTGQKYKLGTGIVLLRQKDTDAVEKVVFSKQGYKRFLTQIILENLDEKEILGFKWLPVKVINPSRIRLQQCGQRCVSGGGCVVLGCVCMEADEICR